MNWPELFVTSVGVPQSPATVAIVELFAVVQSLNVASVYAAKPVLEYATGGIVPGSSYVGDNIPIRANSGEWILNDGQLNRLADIVFNGGSVNNEPITIITPISLDGREVARMVSRYQRNGQA